MSQVLINRQNSIMSRSVIFNQHKKKLTVTLYQEFSEAEVADIRSTCGNHGWTDVIIVTEIKPCGGFSWKTEYIDPEDVPKRDPDGIYAGHSLDHINW